MINKITLLSIILFSVCFSVVGQKQKIETCSAKNLKGGEYKLISVIYPVNTPHKVVLDIWIKPKNFTKEYMTKLATRLRATYCNEDYISVSIFDNKKDQLGSGHDFIISGGKINRSRGYYWLNKKTGEEGISFSTKPGNPIDEVKIIFSEPKKNA